MSKYTPHKATQFVLGITILVALVETVILGYSLQSRNYPMTVLAVGLILVNVPVLGLARILIAMDKEAYERSATKESPDLSTNLTENLKFLEKDVDHCDDVLGEPDPETQVPIIPWLPELSLGYDFYAVYDDPSSNLVHKTLDSCLEDLFINGDYDLLECVRSDSTITIEAFVLTTPSRRECRFFRELYSRIDLHRKDETGNPDNATLSPEALKELEQLESQFIDRFLALYDPFKCEHLANLEVSIFDWFMSKDTSYRSSLMGKIDIPPFI